MFGSGVRWRMLDSHNEMSKIVVDERAGGGKEKAVYALREGHVCARAAT